MVFLGKHVFSIGKCGSQLMEEFPIEWDTEAAKRPGLFLAGDSHCLTGAWRKVHLRGEARVLVPLLTTGLKAWHLRDDGQFYPKVCVINYHRDMLFFISREVLLHI